MDNNFKQEGCEITWTIENFIFLNKTFSSPFFHLSNFQKTDWCFKINTSFSSSLYFYLESKNPLNNISICYSVIISSNKDSSKEEYGFLTFRESTRELLIIFLPERGILLRNLLIQVRLKDISNLSSLLYSLKFRTVVQIATTKGKYNLPHFNELPVKQEVFFHMLPICQNSIGFELKMWVTNEEDEAKILHIDIRDTLNTKSFNLFAKISAEDSNGKLISFVTQMEEFQPNSDDVCSLKIPFTEDALKSFSSNHNLRLKYEFKIPDKASLTWIEESSTLPSQENFEFNNESFEKDAINKRDDFCSLYREGKRSDIIISAQDRKFPVHKTILSARSSVFAAMFDADMAEKENNLVEIVDIEPETLDRMLLFVYSDVFQTEEYGDILKLYEAADKYEIMSLKDKCSLSLKKFLDTQNAVQLLILADMHYDTELQNSIETFICSQAKKVFLTQEWKNLMEEKPSLSCKVMHNFCVENI